MIDVLRQQFTDSMTPEEKVHRTREFLQLMALKSLHDQNAFENLAFVGGTALRIVFDARRYSEDLDFSLVSAEGYAFDDLAAGLLRHFELNNIAAACRQKTDRAVHAASLKFPGLLKELGLSAHASQVLSIKLEVDRRPPKGWNTSETLLNRTFLFSVRHFDLPSLFASKLHACLFRGYVKGRDFYDLAWYLGRKVSPNLGLLNEAIRQTEGKDPGLDPGSAKAFLLDRLSVVDFSVAVKDVRRFIIDDAELRLIDKALLASLVAAADWG